jgi:molybdopterin-dependent oxidoreductase alpha subunit
MGRDVVATTPSESSPPSLSKPKDVAAGIPAVISSLTHGITRMGTLASLRNFTSVNRFDGFDCPGCAWPDPDGHRTIAEFCENGAKAVADEGTRKRAGPEFWSQWSVGELSRKSDQWLNSQGRLTHPMILRPGSDYYSELSWDEAFDIIADELVSLDNPDQAVFYTSGRTSNEAAFLWQLLARRFGTNNLPDCSNMCHESSGVALSDSIGIGKGTVTLDDFTKADLIIVVGQNPGTNHPRMLTALRDAKRAGASIISINPLLETGMKRFKHPQAPLELLGRGTLISDEHVPVRVNGDFALFRGLAKVVMQREALDMEFIDAHTLGFADYRRAVESTSWDSIVSGSGVEQEVISNLGATISKSKSTIVCWAMGLTQHRNSVAIIQEIANLLLLGGHIGRPGAGVCPVRGHSNVQGDRTVGINHNPSAKFLSDLHDSTGIAIPTKPGVDSVRAVKSMRGGTAKVFLSMGGNFVSAMSDTNATASALSNCSITAQISTKPNRSHLVTGRTALILPCLGRSEKDHTSVGEQFVSVENSMGIVHSSRGSSKPASGMLRSEPSIVSGIAGALDTRIGRSGIAWQDLAEDYDKVRDMIEASIPGFEGYNERVRLDGGFYLPNPPRDSRTFPTESGYANFRVHDLSGASAGTGRYLMMTIRSHDQYNTTIYGLDDRYRGINKGRRVVLMNQSDMDDNDWSEGDLVDLTSHFEGTELHAREWYIVPYEIPKGNIATYFPEANVLVPLDSVAEGSNTPTSKSVVVTIRATD